MKQVLPGVVLVIAQLAACDGSRADVPSTTGNGPTIEDIREVSFAAYKPPAGQRQECLGRLVFNVADNLQWGITKPQFAGLFYGFDQGVHAGGEYAVLHNGIGVTVLGSIPASELDHSIRIREAEKGNALRQVKNELETQNDVVISLRENSNKEDPVGVNAAIEDLLIEIKANEELIQAINESWHPYDLGLPDSRGYIAGSTFYAYLWRDQKLYEFSYGQAVDGPDMAVRKPIFDKLVKEFRVRKLYEIPTERGICLPYGFVPDDGTWTYDIHISIRYADQPGVIYAFGTSTVGELGSETTMLHATARASTGLLSSVAEASEFRKQLSERIGPRNVKMGPYTAQQGGVALTVAVPGKKAKETYSVYTGYGGWGATQVFPTITVDMRSFTREEIPALKQDPPPFSESKKRLDDLLKGLRMRPTVPLMPEFERLNQAKPSP